MGRNKTGRNFIRKHYMVSPTEDELIKNYAKTLKKSESGVARELWQIGNSEFRKKYGMDSKATIIENAVLEARDNFDDMLKLAREKERAEPKGEKLGDAYEKKLLFGDVNLENPEREKSLMETEPDDILDTLFERRRKRKGQPISRYNEWAWESTGERATGSDYHMVYDDKHGWRIED